MRHKLFFTIGCATLLIALSIIPAQAQRRHRPIYRPIAYHPIYYGVGQWYPYPGIGYPPMPGFYQGDQFSSLRIQVSQREALVYVDGYAAGMVDDYDGVFQRLQLVPGHHEITVYLQGHRTLRQNLYLTPRSSHTIRHTLVPLGPGETGEPEPVPRVMPQMPGAPMTGMPMPALAPVPVRNGTLALRVQPGDASIYIDGEIWRGPQGGDRLAIQLAEGAHRVRVEKPGFQVFFVDVDVRSGETTSFNVSLVQ